MVGMDPGQSKSQLGEAVLGKEPGQGKSQLVKSAMDLRTVGSGDELTNSLDLKGEDAKRNPAYEAKMQSVFSANIKANDEKTNGNWVIPDLAKGEPPRFGLKGGLQFGFYPGSLDPNNKNDDGGPRGLIRIWSPSMPDKNYCLANFIAVEPMAAGNPEWGSSELEKSQSDWKEGKVMTVDPNSISLKEIAPGVQELSLVADVEKFHNGSHVSLEISERSDQPEELHFKVHQDADSSPLDRCVLTATWGNLTRSREIWLKDGIQNSLAIPSYRVYRGYDFAPDQFYSADKLTRLPNGALAAALTTNETHPDTIHPLFGTDAWYWGAKPITQYWEVPNPDPNLNLRVNGRFMYWNSKWAIPNGLEVPGGITYENFEMREPFHEGQEFVFGVSTKKPEDLGFAAQKRGAKT